jgi:hypothetical protein
MECIPPGVISSVAPSLNIIYLSDVVITSIEVLRANAGASSSCAVLAKIQDAHASTIINQSINIYIYIPYYTNSHKKPGVVPKLRKALFYHHSTTFLM